MPAAGTPGASFQASAMFRSLVIFGCLAVTASAQRDSPSSGAPGTKAIAEPDPTAIGALALLPKDVAARVARIEGPEGHPFPDRWYVLAHEPTFPTGLREFVICEGKVVANRGLSQFADRISAEDGVGSVAVKLNSPEAAGIAAQFALHNGQLIGSIRYEFLKLGAVPVWRLTCRGQDGSLLGTVVLHATSRAVLSFEGFAKSPLEVEGSPAPHSIADVSDAADAIDTEDEAAAPGSTNERPSRSTATTSKPKPKPKRRVQTASRRSSSQGPIDRVGTFFKKIFR